MYEAAHRLMEYSYDMRSHTVEDLPVHLPGKQKIKFDTRKSLLAQVEKNKRTKLNMFFMQCADEAFNGVPEKDIRTLADGRPRPLAKDLTYAEFPIYYLWDSGLRKWKRRVKLTKALGRVWNVSPNCKNPDLFYLRSLLHHIPGPQSFDDLYTYDDVIYDTFREAAVARGLFIDDKEWVETMQEGADLAPDRPLRKLFVTVLVHNAVHEPQKLFDKFQEHMSGDILRLYRREMGNDDLAYNETVKNRLLIDIEELLREQGKTLADYALEQPDRENAYADNNRDLLRELNYNCNAEREAAVSAREKMTQEQKNVYDTILGSINDRKSKLFFLNAPGGTGKTFVMEALLSAVRANGDVALAVASSGKAATLLTGGTTAHKRFGIPFKCDEGSSCNISKNSNAAVVLKKAKICVWDEAVMTGKDLYHAVDRMLRDIRDSNSGFGGLTMVFGGDYKQILPVVKNGSAMDIVNAALNQCDFYDQVQQLNLTVNMRAHLGCDDPDAAIEWADTLDKIGSGAYPYEKIPGDDSYNTFIKLPAEMTFMPEKEKPNREDLLKYMYGKINEIIDTNDLDNCMREAIQYYADRNVLTTTNAGVKMLNDEALKMLNGDEKKCYSVDKCADGEEAACWSPEFLNTVLISGMPPHVLPIKKGCPLMCLRNLDAQSGLCNGTRLIVTNFSKYVIQGRIIGGKNRESEMVLIPRITLKSEEGDMPYTLYRHQFPVQLAFAMTVNKSQGQTMKNAAVYLENRIFTHGQCYVMLSRVGSPSNIKILAMYEHGRTKKRRRTSVHTLVDNIVYYPVFGNRRRRDRQVAADAAEPQEDDDNG